MYKSPPIVGTEKYKEILESGCGGYRDYWGEFDCDHPYEWACDDCPIVNEKYLREEEQCEDLSLDLP